MLYVERQPLSNNIKYISLGGFVFKSAKKLIHPFFRATF